MLNLFEEYLTHALLQNISRSFDYRKHKKIQGWWEVKSAIVVTDSQFDPYT